MIRGQCSGSVTGALHSALLELPNALVPAVATTAPHSLTNHWPHTQRR
ncbi:hypothetical protein [Nocardia sp. NPDC057440]